MSDGTCFKNTDKEIYREVPDDFYSPSIFVTKEGSIGINIAGDVVIAPIEAWHSAMREREKM